MTDQDFYLYLVNECENMKLQINMLKVLLYDTNYQIKQLKDQTTNQSQSS
jgi:hypothetical protein